MATLNLTTGDFEILVLIFLFDMTLNSEQIKNKVLKEFIEKHSSKLKTPLIKAYLDSSGDDKFNYKRIKGIFDGSDKSIQQIRIGPSDKIENKKKKKGIVKKIVKKLLKKEELSLEDKKFLKEEIVL